MTRDAERMLLAGLVGVLEQLALVTEPMRACPGCGHQRAYHGPCLSCRLLLAQIRERRAESEWLACAACGSLCPADAPCPVCRARRVA